MTTMLQQERTYAPEVEALRAAGFRAEVTSTGGGCTAISVSTPEGWEDGYTGSVNHYDDGYDPHLLITDQYGSLPERSPEDPLEGWMVGYYGPVNDFIAGEFRQDDLVAWDAGSMEEFVSRVRAMYDRFDKRGPVWRDAPGGPPRAEQPAEGVVRAFGMPFWHTADSGAHCPAEGCGHVILWSRACDPRNLARCEDPTDATKAMLLLQGEHAEAFHPESLQAL